MKNKTSVTIGIPAFNEEKNIESLIKDIMKQKANTYYVSKVIVYSDGSTDKTVSILKRLRSNKISIHVSKNHKGKAYCLDKISSLASSSILILLDADTRIDDRFFIEKLIRPIRVSSADLTSMRIQEEKPINMLQSLLSESMHLKKKMFELFNNGNNVYTCHGRARALSKKLYKSIKFKKSVIDDAFSYLYCMRHHLKYEYVKSSQIVYRLPATYADHEKQSLRFFHSKNDLNKYYSKELIHKEYSLPFSILASETVQALFLKPQLILYFIMTFYITLKSMLIGYTKWGVATSTK